MGVTTLNQTLSPKKIYLIHGWTYNIDRWQPLVDLLRRSGYQPIQLRVPGLTEPSDKVWTIEDYVAWLHAKIGNEASPILLGHSNGGRISLAYCNTYPTHSGHLFLMDAAGVAQNNLLPRLKLIILRLLARLGKPLAGIPVLRKIFYRLIKATDYNNAPPNMKKTMQHMLAADRHIQLNKVTVPTTIIWGKQDKVTPLSMGRTLSQGISGSELHIIDGARHSPMITHPEAVAKIITDSLKVNP